MCKVAKVVFFLILANGIYALGYRDGTREEFRRFTNIFLMFKEVSDPPNPLASLFASVEADGRRREG